MTKQMNDVENQLILFVKIQMNYTNQT